MLAAPARLKEKASSLLNRFLLAEVVNLVQTSLSLDEHLHRLIALAATTLDAARGTIFLYDAEHDELFSREAIAGEIEEIRIPRSTGVAGAVFNSGKPAIVDDPYSDPRFNPSIDQKTGFRTESLISVPLRDRGGAVMGIIEVLNKRKEQFDQIDIVLLQAIADQAATALANSRDFDEQRREHLQDRMLFETTEEISIELDLDRLLGKIVKSAAALMNAERATLFVHDPATNELWSRVTTGGKVDEIRIPSTIGIAGASFTTALAITVPDAYSDPRFNPSIDSHTGFQTRSLLCVPIVDRHGGARGDQ
jgi:adenylate cyclase